MARSTDALLAQLLRFLPTRYQAAAALLSGQARAMHEAEVAGDDALAASTFAATAAWLDLHARGYGLARADGETDASLRLRLRNPEPQVTRPAILGRADALLDGLTDVAAVMVEPWESASLDVDFYLDVALLLDTRTFALVVPLIGDPVVGVDYFDDAFADTDAFAGEGAWPSIYFALLQQIQRVRAAGIHWYLVIDPRVAEADKSFADTDFFDSSYAVP